MRDYDVEITEENGALMLLPGNADGVIELEIDPGPPIDVIETGPQGPPGQTGHVMVFGTQGPVTAKTGTVGFMPRVNGLITRVTAAVSDQISGATRPDVNVNGTTIFTNQAHRPNLAGIGRHFDDADAIDAPAFTATSYFTADIDVAGNGTKDLIVTVDYVEV